eukprot:TRINITY_DN1894_c0_g1_i1.p1 TRINITY_DN1894_c0_g1~~TRINITY_DN1894_c0_g1_i1.p1  ORF type:complete len:672 (+),score=69.54 TRINITY_DN1894_c0_g1_i1:118-2133(+)
MIPSDTSGLKDDQWHGVMEFLQEQLKKANTMHQEWIEEKSHLLSKIAQLENELKAQYDINQELGQRIKGYEHGLNPERVSRKGHQRVKSDLGVGFVSENINIYLGQNPGRENRLFQKFFEKSGLATGQNEAEDIKRVNTNVDVGMKATGHKIPKEIPQATLNLNCSNNSVLNHQTTNMNSTTTTFNYSRTVGFQGSQDQQQGSTFSALSKMQTSHKKEDAKGGRFIHHMGKTSSITQKSQDSTGGKSLVPSHSAANVSNKKAPHSYRGDDKLPQKLVENHSNPKTESGKAMKGTLDPKKDRPNLSQTSAELNGMCITKKIWSSKCSLRHHFDGVRSIFCFNTGNIIASVSEDCSIKLWDVKSLYHADESSAVEPYFTLRGHAGPLFSTVGTLQSPLSTHDSGYFLYTAGSEGVIRTWAIPVPGQYDVYGSQADKPFCLSYWKAHLEPIWDLQQHSTENILVSSSSDGTIKLWQTFVEDESGEILRASSGDLKGTLFYKTTGSGDLHIPTSLCWINYNTFASGFVTSDVVGFFDPEHLKMKHSVKLGIENYSANSQINKLAYHEAMNVLVLGHEDRQLRFLDINTGKLIKSMVAHTDAVSSIVGYNQYFLSSASHDGSVRTWDLRKYQCLHEIPVANKKKYDEAIHCLSYHNSTSWLMTGGADGIIKIFNSA